MLFNSGARMEKSSGKYGLFSNLHYHYKHLIKWEPWVFWVGILILIPWTITSVIGNVLPATIVAGLEEHWEPGRYLLTLGALMVGMWFCNLLTTIMEGYTYESSAIYRAHYTESYIDKKMNVDYDVLERKDFSTHASAAYTAIFNGRGINDAVTKLSWFLASLAPAIVYAVLLARVQFWIPIVALLAAAGQIWLLKLARGKHSEVHPLLANFAKKLAYLTNETMETAAGKDVRIFHMQKWLTKKYTDNLEGMNQLYYRAHRWYFLSGMGSAALDLVRNATVYVYLIYETAAGRLSIAEFVLYYGFVNSFSEQMVQVLRQALTFGIISNTFSSIREYFDTGERRNEGDSATIKADDKENKNKGKAQCGKQKSECAEGIRAMAMSDRELEEIKKSPVTLKLRDVTFAYEGQETPVISHLNLTINAGEKLALIGLNGAGKTTLVKLICGFYAPTEGEILLNGRNIEEFEREQYYQLISVLFQDYTILPQTLKENIASRPLTEVEEEKLEAALAVSGFRERYERLPAKGESLMVKEIHDTAVDFSGGEKQRLLFARALYKQAPLLILDEPTAALDPIAENEIYLKYSESTAGKTSIYISHRLSSTRFCDRIVLLEGGEIVENGTHTELMERGGRYAQLYEMQSQYYKEQEKEAQRRKVMEA